MANMLKIAGVVGAGMVVLAASSGGTKTQEIDTSVVAPMAQEQKQATPTLRAITAEKETKPVSSCHPGYSGCLKQNAGDYDCSGGSGNGPNYTGRVQVYGSDPFGLDRDNDGWGCE